MTDQPEPEDTCRPVKIDGETIRVRGAEELSDEAHEAITALVRAAKAKMAAEPPLVRQQLRAAAFNAVAPALRRHDEWLRLTVRRTVADAVLAAVEEFLDIGDAEAWCKTCRRVWEGRAHQCESGAEAALARIAALTEEHPAGIDTAHILEALDQTTPATTDADTTTRVFAALHHSAEQDVTRVINLYERWVKAGPPPLGISLSRWWDARLIELRNALRPPADQTKEQ